MVLSRRERSMALAVAVLLGLFLLDGVVVTPGLARWAAVEADIAKAEEEIQKADRVLAREGAAEAQWKSLQGGLTHGTLDQVFYFVDHLWELASRAGTSFQKTEPLKRVDPRGDFNEISYDVRLQCDIRSLARFAYELDHSAEPLQVRRLQVTARPGAPPLDVNVQISTLELAARPPAPAKKTENGKTER